MGAQNFRLDERRLARIGGGPIARFGLQAGALNVHDCLWKAQIRRVEILVEMEAR